MTPHLTASGRTVLVAAAMLIMVGVLVTQWQVLLLGEVLAVLLTLSYYLQVAPLIALEEEFVHLSVRISRDKASGVGPVGDPIELDVVLTNRTSLAIHHVRIRPEHPDGLTFQPPVLDLGVVHARERVSMSLSVRSEVIGRLVLHGMRVRANGLVGLVAVSDYVPVGLPLKFLPKSSTARRRLPRTTKRSTDVQRMGAHILRRPGFGTDFRELRDHAIGDPFRSIAWKATARTGKLMVREFEDEIIANAFVLLDISSTMRGGTPPRTKLQHAIELTAEFAELLARSQDRVGLITFDEVVYGHLRTGSARTLPPHVVNHLVGLTSIVDADFTELDDDEVTSELVRYLMVQERLDFRRRLPRGQRLPGHPPYDSALLHYWLERMLPDEQRQLGDRSLEAGVVSRDELSAVRRFCQLRGVPVPYRLEARFGAKEMGVVQALERFMADNRESHFVLVITDLCGLVETRDIVAALRLVLSRKHSVAVLMPYTPAYVRSDDPPLAKADGYDRRRVLTEVFRLAERRERSRIARSITALGIPVLTTTPDDTIDTLLNRIGGRRSA